MEEGLASSGEGNPREERGMVLFRLPKDQVGVGCEMHHGGRELCQGLMEELGLGQGHGCRGKLVWGWPYALEEELSVTGAQGTGILGALCVAEPNLSPHT